MAVVLEFHRCPCCGRHHDFYLAGEYIFAAVASYSFVCPVLAQAGRLWGLDDPGCPTDQRPPSAVILRPSGIAP